MLVWSNCALYNKPDSHVGKAGIQARLKFEDLWRDSGLEAGLRHPRRSTAGKSGQCHWCPGWAA